MFTLHHCWPHPSVSLSAPAAAAVATLTGGSHTRTCKPSASVKNTAELLLISCHYLHQLSSNNCSCSAQSTAAKHVDGCNIFCNCYNHLDQPVASKGVDLLWRIIMKHISKALRMARAKGITQFYLPPARLSTNGKSHPAFTP